MDKYDVLLDNKEGKGYVYLLGDWEKEGIFKIGVTRGALRRRIKKLQTGNSGEIYVVSYFRTDHPFFIERWMHTKYCGDNILGEWFKMSPDDIKNFKNNCQKFEELYKNTHGRNKKVDLDYL